MGFDWQIKFPHDAIFCVPWYYAWFHFAVCPLIGALILWLPVYYFDKMIQPKHIILKQFLQGSNKKKTSIENTNQIDPTANNTYGAVDNTNNDQNVNNTQTADLETADTGKDNDGPNDDAPLLDLETGRDNGINSNNPGSNINDATGVTDETMASRDPEIAAKIRQMLEDYTDSMLRELSSVTFEISVVNGSDGNMNGGSYNYEIRLPNDICRLIIDFASHEYTIMQLLYKIRRKYYWKYRICNIIFIFYLYFRYFCVVWIFYYLIDEYIKFYKDSIIGDNKWNGKIGWTAYVAFGMTWLFNPMLKNSWVSYLLMVKYKFDSEYVRIETGEFEILPIFTFSHNFQWNKRGINLKKNQQNKKIRYDRLFVRQTVKDTIEREKKKDRLQKHREELRTLRNAMKDHDVTRTNGINGINDINGPNDNSNNNSNNTNDGGGNINDEKDDEETSADRQYKIGLRTALYNSLNQARKLQRDLKNDNGINSGGGDTSGYQSLSDGESDDDWDDLQKNDHKHNYNYKDNYKDMQDMDGITVDVKENKDDKDDNKDDNEDEMKQERKDDGTANDSARVDEKENKVNAEAQDFDDHELMKKMYNYKKLAKMEKKKLRVIKIDSETDLIIPSDLANRDVLYYEIYADTEDFHVLIFFFMLFVELFGIMLSIFTIVFPLYFVGLFTFIPLTLVFICFIGIGGTIGPYIKEYFELDIPGSEYHDTFLLQAFYAFCGYSLVWLFYSCYITCCVSIACLYQGNDWGNCFGYAFKGDYCPNNDTFWKDYYDVGYLESSWQQTMFFFAWHVV